MLSSFFRLSLLASALLLLTHGALACLMVPQPPTALHGGGIQGRFTYEGKPLAGSTVELRTTQGRLLEKTVTDKNGSYTLAVRQAGLYEIRLLKPSHEAFGIDYAPAGTVQDFFDVNFYADYCHSIKVSSK
jgi:hypothetical protein